MNKYGNCIRRKSWRKTKRDEKGAQKYIAIPWGYRNFAADCGGAPAVCGRFLFYSERFHGTCH